MPVGTTPPLPYPVPMPPRAARWLPNPTWLVASMVLALAVIVPAAYLAMPGVYRWHRLSQLTADDPAARERALNYVIRHAGDDPAVREGTLDRLGQLDPLEQREPFNQIVNAFDHAGVWSRRYVPDGLWLKWIGTLQGASEPGARRAAAQHLAKLTDLANEHDVWTQLYGLMNDADESAVRRDALRSAALLAPHTDPERIDIAGFVSSLLRDRSAQVAREAWIVFGLARWPITRQANWRDAPPELAEAMLWTALRVTPDQPRPALEALRDADAPAAARAIAAYALRLSDADAAHRALLDHIAQRPLPDEPGPARTLLKRAVLAAPADSTGKASSYASEAAHLLEALQQDLSALDDEPRRAARPVRAAVAHRLASSPQQDAAEAFERLRDEPVLALALLEGLPVGEHDVPVTRAEPAMLRLIATAKTTEPDLEVIEDLFAHERSPMRDLACVVAVDRFDAEALDELIRLLLGDPNARARMSGAVIAGLAGTHAELLDEAAAIEDDWRVQTLVHAALWMQDRRPQMTPRLPGLLMREDLPMSTLLLALIHRGDATGWDYLLAPHGDPAPDLHRLLTHYRWWHVLVRDLPDDAPPLWLWADAGLQRFQIDVLRCWYRLHRHDLTQSTDPP